MFVTYAPEDGDKQEWTFNPKRIRAAEAQVLLKEFGQSSWDLFLQHIRQNDPHARRVLLWHLTRRDHPLAKFADTPDFYVDELTVELSTVELAEMIDMASAAPIPPDEKAAVLAGFRAELERAQQREAEIEGLEGKAPTPTSTTESTTTG